VHQFNLQIVNNKVSCGPHG